MSYLEHLHGLVIQQQAALHASDLDWFQELVRVRMEVQQELETRGALDLSENRGLVLDIVHMDRAMEDMLRSMADRTMEQLRTLNAGERTAAAYQHYRQSTAHYCDAEG